jgi:hypothetical protein
MPADVLVLAWDLVDEVRDALPWVEQNGGRFVVAVPGIRSFEPRVRPA